jgi:hypothetical protein
MSRRLSVFEVLHPARCRGVHRLDEKGDVECEGGFQLRLHERAVARDGCDLGIGADERGDFMAEGLREMRLDLPGARPPSLRSGRPR